MNSIEIFGAAGGRVSGSLFRVIGENKQDEYMVDCGGFIGNQDKEKDRLLNKSLGFNPVDLNAVVVTHAHGDHLSRLPLLAAQPEVPIYMTDASAAIARVSLEDSKRLSRLYPEGSENTVLSRIVTVPYETPIDINGITLTFLDAGHILGSAIAQLDHDGHRTVFSGDLGNSSPSRIVRATSVIKEANTVVMESTYGDRNHSTDNPVDVIIDLVNEIVQTNGTLLIPGFAIDRIQQLIWIFKGLRRDGTLGEIPVYLDSPMAIKITDVYKKFKHLLKDEVREDKNPFYFDGLIPTRDHKESESIENHRGPKVILAGSGMMNGGRVLSHAARILPDSNSRILLVGFAAPGTISEQIANQAKDVEIEGQIIEVKARICKASLSAHADKDQLFNWVEKIDQGPRDLNQVIVVHGNDKSREAFGRRITEELGTNVYTPGLRDSINLATR